MGQHRRGRTESRFQAMKRSRKALTEAFSNGEIYIAGQTPYGSMFMRDVCALKKDFPLIAWRAWVDTKARYKRSILGPYWLSLSTLTFVVGYSILAGGYCSNAHFRISLAISLLGSLRGS